MATPAPAVPRLTYLRIKNYRALRDVEFRDLTPLTVLIGPNGSGKSTVLDALDFLAEAVRGNLVGAWEKRNRFRGMKTRGGDEEKGIEFELEIEGVLAREKLRYFISIDAATDDSLVVVAAEKMYLVKEGEAKLIFEGTINPKNGWYSADRYYRDGRKKEERDWFNNNSNREVSQDPEKLKKWLVRESWSESYSREVPYLVQSLKGAAETELFTAKDDFILLFKLIDSYRLLHLTDDHLKGYSDAGPREKLSPNGDNLPNVLYYLHERHPEVLAKITAQMRRWVPGLADIVPEITSDERLLLRFKDAPFEKPLPAQYMSGGTMRLAALLTLLYEPGAAGLLGIEEPENELHPQLLPQLAEELIAASETRQLLVATHAPLLLDALEPSQVWILHRDASGYTQATRAADIPGVPELVEDGSPLGYLWTSNSLPVGNPLAPPANAR